MASPESLSPYQQLCTTYYELDKPTAPQDSLAIYAQYAAESKGPILEPMCGTGRYLIPLVQQGHNVAGFDLSPHMLEIARKKLHLEKLRARLEVASFESFSFQNPYHLIMIPTSSFCLLTNPDMASKALQLVGKNLAPGGKFIFEIDTPRCASPTQGIWKGRWIDMADGSKLILNTCSQYDPKTRIDNSLCRYELWKDHTVIKTQVEDFYVRLYEMAEIEDLLHKHSFKVLNKWLPEAKIAPDDASETVLYECVKC